MSMGPRVLTSVSGDAGYIIFGPIGREVLSAGTIIFAICATVSDPLFARIASHAWLRRARNSCQVLTTSRGSSASATEASTGQQALSTLSNDGLCAMYLLLIFAVASLFVALPRTLDRLSWIGLVSVAIITVSGIVGMIGVLCFGTIFCNAHALRVGAGVNPSPGRVVSATTTTSFYEAFLAITNPVCAPRGSTFVADSTAAALRSLPTLVSPSLIESAEDLRQF
jgi:hypothetical protein